MVTDGTEEFRIINNWLGWGNPIGGIWFIGVEEHDSWKCSEKEIEKTRIEIRTKYNCLYSKFNGKSDRPEHTMTKPIAILSAKISYFSSNTFNNNWRSYRDEKLWVGDCKVFNGNILSLGKYRLSVNAWPIGYEELFGFNRLKYQSYLEKVKEHRYKIFRTFREECKPAAIVCFGKSHWKHFEDVFELSNEEYDEFIDLKIKVYQKSRVVLTRHFSRGMSDEIANFVGLKVRQWIGQIP